MFRWLVLISVWLAACTGSFPATDHDVHTGVTRHVSELQTRRLPDLGQTQAAAIVIDQGGERGYGVKLYVTRYDLNYPKIRSAWSFGRQLPYRRDDRRRIASARQEAGHILLRPDAFHRAAERGLVLELVGARATYPFSLPARLFRQALDLAAQ